MADAGEAASGVQSSVVSVGMLGHWAPLLSQSGICRDTRCHCDSCPKPLPCVGEFFSSWSLGAHKSLQVRLKRHPVHASCLWQRADDTLVRGYMIPPFAIPHVLGAIWGYALGRALIREAAGKKKQV